MSRRIRRLAIMASLSLLALGFVAPAAAEPHTTSDLLLPYFEVDLVGQRTTLFAVGNIEDKETEVRITVASNWGIPVLGLNLTLDPGAVRTVNLADWIVDGNLPNRTLSPAQLAHVQAALSGVPSPDDGLYYGSEVEPNLAVGFVTIRVLGSAGNRPDALWGDYFWVDPAGDYAEGEVLVDIDRVKDCPGLCDRHVMRFLEGGAFDGGTELIIWIDRASTPRPRPEPVLSALTFSGSAFYDEPGHKFDEKVIELLPTQALPVADLLLDEDFGWIDMITEELAFIGVRYDAENRFAVALQSWCVEEPTPPPPVRRRPSIQVEKFTNGVDADQPTGPLLKIGSVVTWEYRVTNTGNVRLTSVTVTDNRGVAVSCPRTTLGAGESMVCTASGIVLPGQYSNIGTAMGNPPDGPPVTDADPSHYLGVEFILGEPAVSIEKLTNGQDADTPTGPTLAQGSPVTWTYLVTNTGGVGLTNVVVTDSDPGVTVSCPKTTLAIGESMVCMASGTAEEGQYSNVGTVSAQGDGDTVTDSDPSHYYGLPEIVDDEPAIQIEKLTNGFDADGVASAPHLVHGHPVIWTYIVTNTGNVVLSDIDVTDDQGVAVSCPKTTLDPGESMICTGSGTAVASEECYANVGTVVGTPPVGDDVTDSDPSHYCAEELVGEPAIHIEKYTNGEDADVPTGPALLEGDNVQWLYVVTNTGDVTLTGVTVTDDQGVAVTCAGGQPFTLDPGEVVLCFGNGIASVGQYANVGEVTGTPLGGGDPVTDSDPSHYYGEEFVPEPAIDIEKLTNGEDADVAPGPVVLIGAAVDWSYLVTNVGNVPLTGVTVVDDQGVTVTCPQSTLDVGESMTCTASGLAVEGQYANLGTACGDPETGGDEVCDEDPSHYYGEDLGDEGCTPGYWKNHTDSWPPTGYSTDQLVQVVFTQAAAYPTQGTATLLAALDFGGGPGVEGGVQILLRAAVAAVLNASHPGVSYLFSEALVISEVNAALASGDRDTMLVLANTLDAGNNQGCPLN